MTATINIRNLWLASQLVPVCDALLISDQKKTRASYSSSDFVMSARIASTFSPHAAEDKGIDLAWDEAIASVDNDTLVAIVPIFLRGLLLGSIDPRRMATSSMISRIQNGDLNFSSVLDSRELLEILACSIVWLASSRRFFEEEVQTLLQFANATLAGDPKPNSS
ncbi:hypothetical protein [Hyphomonas sp.]|uniref:hypothetical protein n=1 Tax=Hyphomonas sp. TaxID=87 RepID=UPI003918A385